MVLREGEKVICWDMDETLGIFKPIVAELAGEEVPRTRFNSDLGLTPGIRELLSTWKNQGYHQVITTGAGQLYTEEVLRRSQLGRFMERVYTGTDWVTIKHDNGEVYGKPYRRVGNEYGLSPDEMAHKMLVVGDDMLDLPVNVPDLVLMLHHNYPYCHAQAVKLTTETILEHGAGSFIAGFEALVSRSGGWDARIAIAEGIVASLNFCCRPDSLQYQLHGRCPVIKIFPDERYHADLEPF